MKLKTRRARRILTNPLITGRMGFEFLLIKVTTIMAARTAIPIGRVTNANPKSKPVNRYCFLINKNIPAKLNATNSGSVAISVPCSTHIGGENAIRNTYKLSLKTFFEKNKTASTESKVIAIPE
jgi:hypothetical protein